MEDEEFKKELQELIGMLESLRRIKDLQRRRSYKMEIRAQLIRVMKD